MTFSPSGRDARVSTSPKNGAIMRLPGTGNANGVNVEMPPPNEMLPFVLMKSDE